MVQGEPRIEWVPLGELKGWPRNPRRHDGERIERSIGRFGFVMPPVVDESTGCLVAGHGRIDALRRLKASGSPPPANIRVEGGEWLIPVVRGLSFESLQEAEAYLLADNRVADFSSWEETLLLDMVRDLSETDLELLGFDGLEDFSLPDISIIEDLSAERANRSGDRTSRDAGMVLVALGDIRGFVTVPEQCLEEAYRRFGVGEEGAERFTSWLVESLCGSRTST